MTPILPPSVSSSSSMLAQDKFNGLQPSVTSVCGLLGEPATPSTQRWRNVLANRWNQTQVRTKQQRFKNWSAGNVHFSADTHRPTNAAVIACHVKLTGLSISQKSLSNSSENMPTKHRLLVIAQLQLAESSAVTWHGNSPANHYLVQFALYALLALTQTTASQHARCMWHVESQQHPTQNVLILAQKWLSYSLATFIIN